MEPHILGGAELDWGWSVQQTVDGGFIITGKTESFGAGGSDFWLIKTDPQGNKEWSQTFGGAKGDGARSVQQTACGGFIIAGYTDSFGAGDFDFWLIKTDPQGNKEWSQTFGGAKEDRAASVQQTACGGFIMAGTTYSFGVIEKTKPLPFGEGWSDFWLIKTDPQGNKEWSRTFGGHEPDYAWSVWQTTDGGFILAGATSTAYPRPFLMPGLPLGTRLTCIWVIKTDSYGNIWWTQTLGKLGESDVAHSVEQTACGGFIIAGSTNSFGAGESDFWLIKLAPEEKVEAFERT
ncbi:hypothetical protein M1N82_02040 [Dehalococcoidia bacterium]|nr:hypothetical protein [Dehalococcoidia bacterium]